MRDLQSLGRHVEADWTNERAARVRRGIARKTATRRAGTIAFGVVAAAALAVVGARVTSPPAPPVATVIEMHATPPVVETRKTTTTATPLSNDTQMDARGDRAYVLRAGSARFVVEHDVQHPFTVRAGDVVVEDVGTVFTVAFTGDAQVDVSVAEGSVRVNHDGIASNLVAGEHLEVAAHMPAAVVKAPERARPVERDEVAPLLRAADDARAAGHPESALDPLRRVIDEHPSDSRAGLAAFTLGRVLDELDRPKDAADAFANARAHGGPMAADALGREVVARSRAGDKTRASELGAEYLRLHPRGDRAKEVERITRASP